MLEKVEYFKEENTLLKNVHVFGKSGYATVGAKTSGNNLGYFKEQLKELERLNEEAKAHNKTKPAIKYRTFGSEITKLKQKIARLEEMQERDRNKIIMVIYQTNTTIDRLETQMLYQLLIQHGLFGLIRPNILDLKIH